MFSNHIIKLFHGSKNGLNDKIQPISRSLCDFGKGFYMGTEQEQPLTLICKQYRREGKYFDEIINE